MPPFVEFFGEQYGESNIGNNLLDHIDTLGLLNDTFGMRK